MPQNFLKSLISLLDRLIYWCTAITAVIFFTMVLTSVFSRFLFKTPVMAAVEISRLSFVWACFLAAATAYRQKAHISISVFVKQLPIGVQNMTNQFILILTAAFSGALVYFSAQVAHQLWNSRLPILQLSQGWFYLPVTVSAAYILIYAIEELFEKAPSSNSEKEA